MHKLKQSNEISHKETVQFLAKNNLIFYCIETLEASFTLVDGSAVDKNQAYM